MATRKIARKSVRASPSKDPALQPVVNLEPLVLPPCVRDPPTSIIPPFQKPSRSLSRDDQYWRDKVDTLDYCVICLTKRTPPTNSAGLVTMDHIWEYLNMSHFYSDYVFIVGKESGGDYLESKVPCMCKCCMDKVITLSSLHGQLVAIRSRIENTIGEIQRNIGMSNFLENSSKLEGEMTKARLPFRCMSNAIQFLTQLHRSSIPADPPKAGARLSLPTKPVIEAEASGTKSKQMDLDVNDDHDFEDQVGVRSFDEGDGDGDVQKLENAKRVESVGSEFKIEVYRTSLPKSDSDSEEDEDMSYGYSDFEDENDDDDVDYEFESDENGEEEKELEKQPMLKSTRSKWKNKPQQQDQEQEDSSDTTSLTNDKPKDKESMEKVSKEESKCPVCDKKYFKMEKVRLHWWREHKNGSTKKDDIVKDGHLICNTCGGKYKKYSSLEFHKEYERDKCEALMAKQTGKQKEYICTICNKTFCSFRVLGKHRTSVHHTKAATSGEKDEFKCTTCGKSFTKVGFFQRHILEHKTPKAPKVNNSPRPVCEFCGLSFKTRQNLRRHRSIHSKEVNFTQCQYCGKQFPTRFYLKDHVRLVHFVERGGQRPTCNLCGKVFGTPRYLKNHMVLHEEGPTWPCEICGRVFKRKSNMMEHQKRVHRVKPVLSNNNPKNGKLMPSCGVCGKIFVSQKTLKYHMKRSHSDISKHTCDSCEESFNSKYDLRYHVLQVHMKQHSSEKERNNPSSPGGNLDILDTETTNSEENANAGAEKQGTLSTEVIPQGDVTNLEGQHLVGEILVETVQT